jgi:anti-sigma B factor antagonist
MPVEQLSIKLEKVRENQIAVIRLSGHLDAHTFESLQETLADLFDDECYRVIVDMSDVGYMSSAGAGVLIGALSQTRSNDGQLVLMKVRQEVMQVLKVLGIIDIFPLAADEEAALAAF